MIGGGAAGVFYLRQLLRAEAKGRVRLGRLAVVDRDPACATHSFADPRVEHHVRDWSEFLDAELAGADPAEELVPYHWAPHLLVEWLRREAVKAGGRALRGEALPRIGAPYERDTRERDRALSYATWSCPPTCIEPALCPHTRGEKSWSLARELGERRFEGLDTSLVLPSLHFAYGVATVPVAAVQAARLAVLAGLARGERRYLVATASHCHGLATRLDVAPA